jgi:hypothetical protein
MEKRGRGWAYWPTELIRKIMVKHFDRWCQSLTLCRRGNRFAYYSSSFTLISTLSGGGRDSGRF